MEKGVLTVRDNEHSVVDTVGGNEVACRKLPGLEKRARENPQGTDPVSRLYFSRGDGITNPIILIYNYVI